MFNKLLRTFFGSRNQRLLKQYGHVVQQINQLESTLEALDDMALKSQSDELRQRHQTQGEALDTLLPEAFALVREASKRILGMRHFDVQLLGGMVLHHNKIAEMRTGEGKTLMATLPCYLNALSGKGVHVITVNDYLANRDAQWMRPLYEFLGCTVGVNLSNMSHDLKQVAYAADITYGTNNEFGFDYLRDNMAFNLTDKVQRDLNFCVIDEVDSILIDEARTPLIISGPSEESSELYAKIDLLIPKLVAQQEEEGPGDFSLDEKAKQAHLTEEGHQHVEALLTKQGLINEGESLYDMSNISLMYYITAALRAHHLFARDVDYIVTNNEIVIVDEHTGRTMPGRRWSDGLHQAMEAKEGVHIQSENQTLASITFQNYFRLYQKLSGMTGTADTEAYEFQQIYGLEVVVVPTNKPMVRKDMSDQIYLTAAEKFDAILTDIKACCERGQPVLVGTVSIETSEFLSGLLHKNKIPHQVLNAKFHEKEAQIIAEAGRPGAVTIATNMAGRGTDIVLGGSMEAEVEALGEKASDAKIAELEAAYQQRHQTVLAAGGLHILGTERHESRRIDNQLRGRAGRQGDPGSSRFYLSLEDNLMRIFAPERVAGIMQKLGMKKGEAIEHPWVTKAIENAQRKVEGRNFDIRKELLEFDNVANDQRKVIYQQRAELMAKTSVLEAITSIRETVLTHVFDEHLPPGTLEEQWDLPALEHRLEGLFGVAMPVRQWLEDDDSLHADNLKTKVESLLLEAYAKREAQLGTDVVRNLEKAIMLQSLDGHWKEHLATMDHLRQGIHLRGYAQKNPKQEYKREAFILFSDMLDGLKEDIIHLVSVVQVETQTQLDDAEAARQRLAAQQSMEFHHDGVTPAMLAVESLPASGAESQTEQQPYVRSEPKVGRNAPCPCGSGRKYKQCCGKITA